MVVPRQLREVPKTEGGRPAEALMSDNDETSSIDNDNRRCLTRTSPCPRSGRRQEATPSYYGRNAQAGPRGRHKLELSGEEAERRAAERRARNAFLARVRRASKRAS